MPQKRLLRTIEESAKGKKLLPALHAFNAFYLQKDSNRWDLAHILTRLALEQDNRPAIEVAELFEDNIRYLWNDGNYSGQGLYTLILGPIGEQTNPYVADTEVLQLIANAQQSPSLIIPSWCCDGIHTPGQDPRFAGTLKYMAAACTVFEKLGRLDPRDDWSLLIQNGKEGNPCAF